MSIRSFVKKKLLRLTRFARGISYADYSSEKFYSQDGQDFYLSHLLRDRKQGTFVEVGAHDGITCSNTYFFERVWGWRGVCIEPIPSVFEKLKANRSAVCIQACVSDQAGVVRFLEIEGHAEMLSGISSAYHPRHRERIEREITGTGGGAREIQVQSIRLSDLFGELGIREITYLSIDTEGSEMNALKSIDFGKVSIEFIGVENNYGEPLFEDFLRRHGYKLIKVVGADEIYQKSDCLKPCASPGQTLNWSL